MALRLRRAGQIGRLDQLSWGILCLVMLIGLRLFYLQVLRYPHFRQLQSRQVVSRQEVPARRGRILDRQGRTLAFDIVGYDVSVLKKHLRPGDLNVLADALAEDPAALQATLARGGRFVTLRRATTLSPGAARRLGSLPGVCLDKRSYRQYPFGTLGAQLLGFTDAEGHGVEGVEKTFDAALRGTPGEVLLLRDENGDPIGLQSSREPEDGADLVLTVDLDMQMIADAELQLAVHQYGARDGSVLVLDPHSGEILACANAPLPADRDGRYDPDEWRNRAVCDLFEPGSTLKPLTAIAALRRGVVGLKTRIYAERGAMRFGSAGVIHDAHHEGDGWLTFPQAFAKSSNICFAKVARALTSEALYDELRAFGFGSPTGVDLPGEAAGRLALPRDWSGRTRLSLGYGQEISVTALQLAGLYTTIANGGTLLRPHVAARLLGGRDDDLHRSFASQEVRRLLAPELTSELQELCRLVVVEGTGAAARVDGVATAGKTGTAQKAVGGRYAQRYVASFGGFVPAEEPRFVCLVVLDEPHGVFYYGGLSAAPTFGRIVQDIVRGTRQLQPQADRVVLVRGDELHGGPDWRESALRVATLDGAALPDLRGLRLQAAANWLRRLGAEPRSEGAGVVAAQWPGPGEKVTRGDVVRLRCRAPRAPSLRAALLLH